MKIQKKRLVAASLLVAGMSSITSNILAQPKDRQTQAEFIREEIIVTADRSETKIKETGSSVSLINDTYLRDANATFATEIFRQLAGLSVNQSGHIGSAAQIRIRGAEANHTLVLIDGINVNDPAIGSEFNFGDLMLGDTAQIEIVRGSQTALYGSDTIGGVINIKTFNPKKSGIQGNISADTGTNETSLQKIKLAAKGDHSYVATSISKYSTDGSSASMLGSEKDGYSTQTAMAKLGVDLSKTVSANFFFRRSDNHTQTDPQDFSYPATITQGLVIDGDEHSDTTQEHRGISIAFQGVDGKITSQLRLNSTRTQSKFFQADNYALGSQGGRDGADWHSTIDFNHDATKHRLGILLAHEELTFENYSQSYLDANYREKTRQTSLATAYHLALSDSSHFNFSVRADHNSRFKDNRSLRGSFSHLFNNGGTRLHTSLGKGSTNPSFLEIFGYAPSNFEGNPDLTPEKSVNIDLGLEQSLLNGNGIVDMTVFSARLENEIVTVFDSKTFKSSPVNQQDQSKRRGLEISARASFKENWGLFATYTHLKAEDDLSLTEIRRPKHNGSINLNYRSNNKKTNINISAVFNGEQEDLEFIAATPETRVILPAYRLVNLSLSYDLTDKFKTQIKVFNLLDSEYSEVFSYRAPGRSLLAGLEYQF